MPKRKPDQVIVHRIELNTFERDLLETALVGQIGTSLVNSTVPPLVKLLGELSDPVKLYSFLTILELADLLETPLPTLGDVDSEARSAFIAIKDFLGFELAYDENAEATQENAEILASQAQEAEKDAYRIAEETGEAYRNGQASYEDLQASQVELNKAVDARFRADLIAIGWEYKFQFENNRWPTKAEVAEAKKEGVYYPSRPERKMARRGFVRSFVQSVTGFRI
tara:strand:+ start:3067 stop:3741 length:675 start_codon:yes stop_codon:yes gene_type:complete